MSAGKVCLAYFVFLMSLCGAQNVPRSSHVWMITEENHSYEDVVGNTQMPYYNHLIHKYGLATQFYADQHSSLPALMWLVSGAAVELDNDTVSCKHSEDNIVRELLKQHYSWRSYETDMPYAGFQGLYGGTQSTYYRRHNPLLDFTDVCPDTGQSSNSVPYSQMALDFAQGNTVNYAYITPDSDDDAHDGTLQVADGWLQKNVPAILARPEFAPGGDGILFVVWDEGKLYEDNRCSATVAQGCGGRTATLVIGPQVKPGYLSTNTYHSVNVLKTICVAMGLSPCPGAAQNVAPMADFFKTASTAGAGPYSLVISTPGNGASVVGAVHLIATASANLPVRETQVWDNGVKLGVYGSNIDAIYNLSPGVHTTTAFCLDSQYRAIEQKSVTYSVQPLISGLQIISPVEGSTIKMSTVHVVGHASEPGTVNQMQVWDNGIKLGWYTGVDVNQYYNLAPGTHTVSILDLDNRYKLLHQSSVSYTVR